MAEEQQSQQPAGITAPFPTPPPFYKHFTQANLAKLRQLRKEAGASQREQQNQQSQITDQGRNESASTGIDILSLPPELRYLIPPPHPAPHTAYRSFGTKLDLHAAQPTLTESGIEQLFTPNPDTPHPQLIALARSLLTTFLSLVGVLSQNPEHYAERVADLQTIMYNAHDIVNRYRPHQARESLINIMAERVESMRGELRRIEEARKKIREVLRGVREQGEEAGEGMKLAVEGTEGGGKRMEEVEWKKTRLAKQRAAWAKLEEETGAGG